MFLFLLGPAELHAWERESEVVNGADHTTCRVYKDWVLKFHLKPTQEEPEGGPGSRIFLIKRTPENLKSSCDSSNGKSYIEVAGKIFVGYSAGFLYLKRYKSAPGSGSVQIFEAGSGKKMNEIFTSGQPIEVKGTKIVFWDGRRNRNDFECKDVETDPGLGCIRLEKIEFDLTSGIRVSLGEKKVIPIQ